MTEPSGRTAEPRKKSSEDFKEFWDARKKTQPKEAAEAGIWGCSSKEKLKPGYCPRGKGGGVMIKGKNPRLHKEVQPESHQNPKKGEERNGSAGSEGGRPGDRSKTGLCGSLNIRAKRNPPEERRKRACEHSVEKRSKPEGWSSPERTERQPGSQTAKKTPWNAQLQRC